MNKYALLLEYEGSQFCGWQIQQPGVKTIQGELERALSLFANHPVATITAGRTDTGVHACHQVVHFYSAAERKLAGWVTGVNANLPATIRIKEAIEVADSFDARFSAVARTYHYYLLMQPVNSAFLNPLVGWYYQNLDLTKMQLAANLLLGIHDFSSFRASACQANTAVRNMLNLIIEQRGQMLRFSFTANAFLHHMIRNIVGALVYVGCGKLTLSEFEQVFKACSRKLAPPTFMPNGLYLVDVSYPEEYFKAIESNWLFHS